MTNKHVAWLYLALLLGIPLLYCQDATNSQSSQTPPGQTDQAQADLRRQVHSQQVRGAIPRQISTRLARESGDIRLYSTNVPPMVVLPPDFASNLKSLSCQSDLVALGKVGPGTSQPTVDDGYIYTDWDLTIEQAIKNNAKSPVGEGQTIIVTQSGGTLQINGRRVYTLFNDRQFHTGNEVVLYLRYLPATGTYSLSGPTGFILSDSKVTNLSKITPSPPETTDKIGLLDLAVQAAREKCPERKEGQK